MNAHAELTNTNGERVSNFVYKVNLVICLVFVPYILLKIVRKPLKEYYTRSFQKRWSFLHEDIRIDDKVISSYFIVYVTRRLIYLVAAFFCMELPSMQLLIIYYENLFVLLYTGQKPLVGRMLNRYEMVNEIVVFTVCWHLMFFTDWVDTEDSKVKFGWSMITIIVLHMLF